MPHQDWNVDRRGFARTLFGAFALVGLGGADDAPAASLADLARRTGLRFGSAVRAESLAEPELARLLVRQCATLTPELELKWAPLSPRPDSFDTAGADAIAAFARDNGLRLRGHTLLWHKSVPEWLGRTSGWAPAERHIHAVMERYGALVDEWDVVNEPIDRAGLRNSVLLRRFGVGYIARALRTAHEAAPAARLFLNDYDLEYPIPEQADRRKALLALIASLRRQGAPLHGVGIQAHLSLARGPIDAAVLRDFLAALADQGLAISITELDVRERDYILPAPARDAAVADHVARFLEVALAQPAVGSLSTWGLSDRQSWLEVTPDDLARFPGAWQDGTGPGLNRGLPYDAGLAAKPMRGAIAGALTARRVGQ